MIHPYTVGPMALVGFTWYQGEANVDERRGDEGAARYACTFPGMIKQWRRAFANPNATVLGRGIFLLLCVVLGWMLALGWRWWRARHEPAGWAFVPVGAVALGAQLALASVGIGCQYAKGDVGCRALVGGLAGATGLILVGYSAAVLVVYRRPLPPVVAVVPETQNQPG